VIEEGGELGYPKTEAGKIDGLGLVDRPASKPTAFDQQTAERSVALASGQTDKGAVYQTRYMADVADLRDRLEEAGIETEELSDEDVMGMAETLHNDLMGMLEMAEHDNMGPGGEDGEEDEEDDKEDRDMMDEDDIVGIVQDEMAGLKEDLQEMRDAMLTQQDMAELAEADTVEEIEQRLSDIESEPTDPKTLAEGGDMDNDESLDFSEDRPG